MYTIQRKSIIKTSELLPKQQSSQIFTQKSTVDISSILRIIST